MCKKFVLPNLHKNIPANLQTLTPSFNLLLFKKSKSFSDSLSTCIILNLHGLILAASSSDIPIFETYSIEALIISL